LLYQLRVKFRVGFQQFDRPVFRAVINNDYLEPDSVNALCGYRFQNIEDCRFLVIGRNKDRDLFQEILLIFLYLIDEPKLQQAGQYRMLERHLYSDAYGLTRHELISGFLLVFLAAYVFWSSPVKRTGSPVDTENQLFKIGARINCQGSRCDCLGIRTGQLLDTTKRE